MQLVVAHVADQVRPTATPEKSARRSAPPWPSLCRNVASMTQPETEIRPAWRHVAGPDHDGYVDALLIRYAEAHRHYHAATHIMFVLRHVHDMHRCSLRRSRRPRSVAAGVYHDTIYDPGVDDNEAVSAVLAARDLAEADGPPHAAPRSQR